MRRPAWLSWMATAIVLALPQVAHADGPLDVTLAWDAPDGCMSRDEAQATLGRLLVGSIAHEALDAEVKITVDPRGKYRARLRTHLRGVRGERTLSAASCRLVASAATLVLALTLDPTLSVEPPRDEPDPPPSAPLPAPAPSERAPPEPPAPAPAAATRAPTPVAVTIGASGLLDVGLLPSPAPGGEARVAVAIGWATFVAGGALFASQSASRDGSPSKGGRFTLLAASLRGCAGAPVTPALRANACVGVEVDRIHGEGFGVTSPNAVSKVWLAPRAGAELTWRPVWRFAITAGGDAVAPLDRPTFALENVGAVHRPSPLGFRAALGLAIAFE